MICFSSFFNLVFGKNKKVNTASEILYFYICWFHFAFSSFIYMPLSLDVFKLWVFFFFPLLCDFICLECGDKGISVFLNC